MNKIFRLFGIFLVLLACVHMNSCKKDSKSCEISSNLSFKNDIQPIFDQNCTTSGCHSGTNPKGNLNLESSVAYDQLTSVQSGYVNLEEPAKSLIYASMNAVNNPMPTSGKLKQCTVDHIFEVD